MRLKELLAKQLDLIGDLIKGISYLTRYSFRLSS